MVELSHEDILYAICEHKNISWGLAEEYLCAYEQKIKGECISNLENIIKRETKTYENGINDCLDIVEKVQAECIKNDGCRNKCDEPYACAYGTRIFGEILALKEQKNED